MTDAVSYLDMWKDAELSVYVTKHSATTGELTPATGLSGEFRIAATEFGTAIGTLTGLTVTERASQPGEYAYTLDLAVMTSELPAATYPQGMPVFLQFYKANDVNVESFRKIIRRKKY